MFVFYIIWKTIALPALYGRFCVFRYSRIEDAAEKQRKLKKMIYDTQEVAVSALVSGTFCKS